MKNYGTLAHTTWECKYHVVFIPKCRKKILYGNLRKYLGGILKDLVRDRGSEIEGGYLCSDHVHMVISIPPKFCVSEVIGYIKGKSAIYVARNFLGRRQNYGGYNLWARGYFVSTVGWDEETIKAYVRNQEEEDKKLEQGDLFRPNEKT